MTFRIAVPQPSAGADARRNGAVARDLMRSAAAGGARLVHFPEGFLSGYAHEQTTDWAAAGDELGRIAGLAADLGLWVVLGSAHPLTAPHRPHNSLYVISDAGRIVDRYDKRLCSHTEITRFYTPGFEPVVFDVDGFRFGLALCIEVNFPSLFAEYERLGVDCLLLSAYPVDAVLAVKARAHAAINCYWLSLSVPAHSAHLMPSGVFGPDGDPVGSGDGLVFVLDRAAPGATFAFEGARQWRARAGQGDIYRDRRVDDPRSRDRTCR